MRRFAFAALAAALAPAAFAGIVYRFESTSSGTRAGSIAGRTVAEGTNLRVELTTGDGTLFKDGAVVLSSDGGRTLHVVDPQSKTYYDLQIDQLLGNVGSMFKQFGGAVKVSVSDPKVTTRDAGDGGKIEGYPTHHSVVDSGYTVNVEAMGATMAIHIDSTTESWSTKEIPAEYMNFLQARGMRTGIAEVDKIVASQAGATSGFPLKQTTTVHINQNGSDMTTTSTVTVTGIEKKAIAAAEFALPQGLTKVDNPLELMVKRAMNPK
jgi:hypothetical protein